VPRFLSAEWVDAYNASLAGLDPGEVTGSLRASSGQFSVEQVVSGVPGRPTADGPLRMVLSVDDGVVSLAEAQDRAGHADVVVLLDYADAAALSRGELDPTEALGAGRVQVRGDLSVLVAGQALLASAAGRMEKLQQETTY
jgi:SCP-2 sterol transfer family